MSIQLIWESSTQRLNLDEVILRIHNTLMEAKRNTVFDGEIFIEEKCPKRDGDMQKSFLKYLHTSNVQSAILTITIACDESYAKYVFDMNSLKVRHYNTDREHSGKKAYGKYGPVFLNDPNAEGNFFEKFVEYITEQLSINFDKAKYLYLNGQKYQKEVFTIG